MKMNLKKPSTVEEFKLVTRFENLRDALLQPAGADRLEKPLAFWALASDRRLPLAFLGKPLGELLAAPFAELLATPGIGQKKMGSLLTLLERALHESPAGAVVPAVAAAPAEAAEAGFDPDRISEAVWAEWREAVVKQGLGTVELGRLAPTLQALPTVIWSTPLGEYTDLTLAEVRQLKTHGEKRVRVVLEVFSIVYHALAGVAPNAEQAATREHLSVRLEPKFVRPLENWMLKTLGSEATPNCDTLRDALALPLLEQVRVDLGDAVAELAAGRVGVEGEALSVRNQAEGMNVTRARVYQLLDDCAKVMQVRWPEGEWLFAALEQKFRAAAVAAEAHRLFRALHDLFYPQVVETPQYVPAADHHLEPSAILA